MKLLNSFYRFIVDLFKQRFVFKTLVFRDFQSRYLSSYIGLPWAFIHPAVYILVIWFAFSFGLRGTGNSASNIPFVAWMIAALIPWMYCSQTMLAACNCLNEYSYVIKKTAFNVALIPIVKIFSGLLVQLFLMLTAIILFALAFKIYPEIYWIQIFYYFMVEVILLTGIAWFVASVNVFVRDIAHIINILTTMMFWATPIIWPYSKLSGNYKYVALLNPFFYITEGYRYTFLEKRWFFEFVEMNIYFWSVTLFIFIGGALTFQKLKADFGDEL